MNLIYGVDSSKKLTPEVVRNAIVICFEQAHGEATKSSLGDLAKDLGEQGVEKFTKANIESIVRKAFRESGGDFELPTKESIIKAMNWLAEFSKSFRSPEIIKMHYNEVLKLVNKLK
ncbi:hypothetical protein KKF61_01325 [Patescibacteria group bacterium]|nr:hypothetical protein [Patescibacteria group bacterium]MBU0963726.1 hypothetical protein [Patescibacteria group bacterium]